METRQELHNQLTNVQQHLELLRRCGETGETLDELRMMERRLVAELQALADADHDQWMRDTRHERRGWGRMSTVHDAACSLGDR